MNTDERDDVPVGQSFYPEERDCGVSLIFIYYRPEYCKYLEEKRVARIALRKVLSEERRDAMFNGEESVASWDYFRFCQKMGIVEDEG